MAGPLLTIRDVWLQVIVDKASENQPLLIAEIGAVLAKDSAKVWKVDGPSLRNGYTAADVYAYMRKLYRRTTENYATMAPWLEEDPNPPVHPNHDFVSAPTAHHRANGHIRRSSAAMPTTAVAQAGAGHKAEARPDVGYHLVKLSLLLVLLVACLWANRDYEASRDMLQRAARRVANAY